MLPDLDTVIPYFQPIVNSADRKVFAYEVLARQKKDGVVRSLGPFFEDPAVPDGEKLILDLHVRRLAFEAYRDAKSLAKLFINMQPSWVYRAEEDPERFSPLALCGRSGVSPERLVIEVTEEGLSGDPHRFTRALSEYRRAGCLLAIDDYGKGSSSIERIAYVAPDIIKLDHAIVRRMDIQNSFFELCEDLRTAGATHGFTLLFEGVETVAQLERCVKSGWCYLQGWVLAKPGPELTTDYEHRDLLADILSLHSFETKWEQKRRKNLLREMQESTIRNAALIPQDDEALAAPRALHAFAATLPYHCLRCAVLDEDGVKLSALCAVSGQNSVADMDDPLGVVPSHKVVSQGLQAINEGGGAFLSGVHRNVLTKEPVRTFLYPLRENRLLCVESMGNAM